MVLRRSLVKSVGCESCVERCLQVVLPGGLVSLGGETGVA